jgi:ribosomal protein S12 methylthiotransferase
MLISRFQKVAITAAVFASFPNCGGDLVSRPAAEVLREAEKLVQAGVRELLVIAQDTSAYGVDLRFAESRFGTTTVRAKFVDLAQALAQFGVWIRLHYVYPYPHVDAVVELMAAGKILPYLDIPFQHAAAPVLKAMRRPGDQERTLERIRRWRELCPALTIRSTFIVGFPGETDGDFDCLLDWLAEACLERVGAFKYEAVSGAAANELGLPSVPEAVKEERYRRLMSAQQAISARLLAKKIGSRQSVLIDRGELAVKPAAAAKPRAQAATDGLFLAKGRSKADAPEIDGSVYVRSRRPLRSGEMVTVKIERSDAYDLHGTLV